MEHVFLLLGILNTIFFMINAVVFGIGLIMGANIVAIMGLCVVMGFCLSGAIFMFYLFYNYEEH